MDYWGGGGGGAKGMLAPPLKLLGGAWPPFFLRLWSKGKKNYSNAIKHCVTLMSISVLT